MPLTAPARDEVQVWRFDLNAAALDPYAALLDAGERDRAARFHGAQLRLEYQRCRCALRLLLAAYLGRRADAIALRYGAFGKPELEGLHFNVSHSEHSALIAVAALPLGVDLEFARRPGVDLAGMAGLVFHPSEQASFARLPASAQGDFFYRIWTHKEAYCKALGLGLQHNLNTVCFEPIAGSAALRVRDPLPNEAGPFYVHPLTLEAAFSASVCLPLAEARITLREGLPVLLDGL
ncbi:4'-phosphopantetheinyl transferase [Oxalobacteraceae bacterium GrIS 1.11]